MSSFPTFLRRLASATVCIVWLVGAAVAAPAAGWNQTQTRAHAPAAAFASDVGTLAETETVPIAVVLRLREQPALDALTDRRLAGAATPVLSTQQFVDRHAPTIEQVQRVVAHLRAAGFENIVVAPNRLLVTADGTPGRIRTAFRAELHAFDVAGRRAYANVTDALVPASLADSVLSVVGLQTVQTARTYARRAERLDASTLAVTGVSPTLLASIYGASGLPSASTATLGIITQGSMTQTLADLKTFAAGAGYPAPTVAVVTVGRASSDTSGVDEWNLDTQTALATAGGTVASLRLYTATTLGDANLLSAYNAAVSENVARVVNVSLGECETDADRSGARAAMDQVFQAAVAQGQTFSVASGDSGSYSCGGSADAQSYPAVSPYVMAIGGTTLSSSGASWLGETAWSCSGPSTCPQNASGGTGGGVSLTEPAPAWQTAAGVLTTAGRRGVPDIAFDAAPASGARIVVRGSLVQFGGTSLSAPIFTGLYSRIQAAHGNTLGFPAATIYAGAASNPAWFHDVTSGSNGGYGAGPGWDYVTGWGSLQVQNYSSAIGGTGTGGGGAAPSADWTQIATEGQTFSVAGTQTVRYGAGSSWITRTVTGGGTCSNDFFGGDPLVGTVKVCQVSGAQAAWTRIATEGQTFSVAGTQTVRYGAGSSWLTRAVTGGGTCSNDFFGGDPLYGTVKACEVAAGTTSPATAWTRVASEGQPFAVAGTRTVRYGSGTSFVTRSVSASGVCSNDFFGSDPLYGVVKACDVGN